MALERIKVWIAGEILTAADLNAEFDNIVDYVNTLQSGIDTNTANIVTLESDVSDLNVDILDLQNQIDDLDSNLTDYIDALVPVGVIIPFYDFNAAVSFDVTKWKYCDGAVVSDVDSPLDGLTLPDLSGRYIVGFGTDGGEDIDTATWATTPVGNAAHQIALNHTHTSDAHTHTITNHTHAEGSLAAQIGPNESDSNILQVRRSGTGFTGGGNGTDRWFTGGVSIDTTNDDCSYIVGVEGTTASDGAGNTGSTAPGATGSSLSSTQSIQPRSLRVRYLIRYK